MCGRPLCSSGFRVPDGGSMTRSPSLRPEERAGSGAWTEAGPHSVARGVHRIPLPLPGNGLRAVNAYAIEDGARVVLVDAGWDRDECWVALERGSPPSARR